MNTNPTEFAREGLSIYEACNIARIGRTKIYEAISSGKLKARKLGKRTLVLRADLQEFLASLPDGAGGCLRMARHRPDRRRVKIHRPYTVDQAARTLGIIVPHVGHNPRRFPFVGVSATNSAIAPPGGLGALQFTQ